MFSNRHAATSRRTTMVAVVWCTSTAVLMPAATFAQSTSRQGISPPLLAQLVRACAPAVDPMMQSSVIAAESSGNAWALHDNNDNHSYYPHSYEEAVATAERVIADDRRRYGARDSGLDVGIGQINSNNFPGLRVNAATMLHPCANLRQSSSMLARGFSQEYARLSGVADPQRVELATRGALQIYNSGKDHGDNTYVERVLLASNSALVRGMQAPYGGPAYAPAVASYPAFGPSVSYGPPPGLPYVQPQPAPPPAVSDTLFAHDDPFRRESRAAAKAATFGIRTSVAQHDRRSAPAADTVFAHEDPFKRDRDAAGATP